MFGLNSRALSLFFCGLLSIPGAHSAEPITPNNLAELDAQQKTMVATADVDGLATVAHPDLRINAPTNRIFTRDQFLAMMCNGQIGAEGFERIAESVTATGKIGVVMGDIGLSCEEAVFTH